MTARAVLLALLSLASAQAVAAAPRRAALPRYDSLCVLQGVLAIMELPFNPNENLPAVYFEGTTPLRRFQDAVEPQWGTRPEMFLNAYAAARNEVYLIDEAGYYERLERFPDDSLAHELVHFVQVKYKGVPIEQFDDSQEHQAVAVQTEFRERFMRTGRSPCAP